MKKITISILFIIFIKSLVFSQIISINAIFIKDGIKVTFFNTGKKSMMIPDIEKRLSQGKFTLPNRFYFISNDTLNLVLQEAISDSIISNRIQVDAGVKIKARYSDLLLKKRRKSIQFFNLNTKAEFKQINYLNILYNDKQLSLPVKVASSQQRLSTEPSE